MNNNSREKNTLGKDTVNLTFSKVMTTLITLLTGMLLSRFRSLEEYGTYSQILLVITLFSSVFMLGLPNSINYFLARVDTKEDEQRFLSVYYTLSTILCIIMGGTLVLCVPLIEHYFANYSIHTFAYFLAVYPWASIISSSIENILVVYKRTKMIIIYRLANSGCILGSIILIQALGLGFNAFLICFLAINVVFAILVYLIAYRLAGKIGFRFSRSYIREILVFSLPLGLATMVGTLDVEIDKLLIGRLMSIEQLAIYTNAAKELPVTMVAASITAVLLPRMTVLIKQKRDAEAIKLWNTATELSFIIMGLIVSGCFAFAEEVMEILYSDKYLSGVGVFRIYILILLLRVTYFGIILNAKGKTKQIFWCSLMALLTNAIMNPIFYNLFGMTGPALATGLSILIISVFQLVMTSKETSTKFCDIFPWNRCLLTTLICVIFSILFVVIKKVLPMEEIYSNVIALFVDKDKFDGVTNLGDILESVTLGAVWTVLYLLIMKNRIKVLWNTLNEVGNE